MYKYLNSSELVWLIDVDSTLYDYACNLERILCERFVYYISFKSRVSLNKAEEINSYLYKKYKHTLVGAIKEKLILKEEIEELLQFVHDFNIKKIIKPNNYIIKLIKKIKGRKIIYSNSNIMHIRKILKMFDLKDYIDEIYDIRRLEYNPKPNYAAFNLIQQQQNFDYANSVLIDDSVENLRVAQKLGIKTFDPKNIEGMKK